MCLLAQQHMSVVRFNHLHTGSHLLAQRVDAHGVVCECHGGIVVPQAV